MCGSYICDDGVKGVKVVVILCLLFISVIGCDAFPSGINDGEAKIRIKKEIVDDNVVNIAKCDVMNGGSYIPLPKWVENKKAIINVKNLHDNYCFAYSLMCKLHPVEKHPQRVTKYPNALTSFNFDGIEFPVKVTDLKKFERQNPEISVNVYGVDGSKICGPIYFTQEKKNTHVNLLLLQDDDTWHYCFIKDLSRLCSSQLNKSRLKKFICDRCLAYFHELRLLVDHEELCKNFDSVHLKLPEEENKILKFKAFDKKEFIPFVVFADFESLLMPMDTCQPDDSVSYTMNYAKHEPYAVAMQVVCNFDAQYDRFTLFRGKDCVERFLDHLKELCGIVEELLDHNEEMKFPSDLNQSMICHICKKKLDPTKDKIVKDHNHFTGVFRGLCHNQSYLMKFGYMDRAADGAFALRTEESVRDAIRDMQEFAGIPATGHLDLRTIKLLNTPRCGLPDKNLQTSGRRKRFTLHGQKWPHTNLTWSVRSTNMRQLDMYEVRHVFSKALDVWARHSKLNFQEVDSNSADILIYFYSGDHNDNFPFDGKGVILAHAFFPNNGRPIDVHFDADESWTTTANSNEGTNLFNVAAHEFGHSLGLSHSSVEGALMYPWYKEMDNGFDYELPEDDTRAIQTLYGPREEKQWDINPYRPGYAPPPPPRPPPTTTTTTTTTPRTYATRPRSRTPYNPYYPDGRHPDRRYPYNPPRDGAGKPSNPRKPMHPDKKPHYPKQHPSYGDPERKYPLHRHSARYPETTTPRIYPGYNPDKYPDRRHHNSDKEFAGKKPPDTCDTSYDSIAVIRREVFIFKDAYFWRIGETGGLMPGYPAEITRLWRELPRDFTHVDAVYERPDNKIVFFIDDKFYVFTGNRLERGYPRPLRDLGLPATLKKIDGAMVWGHNGKTYFYSGSMYWRFDEDEMKVELDYPRDMSMWKGVGTDIDAVFQWKDGRTYFFKGKGFWKFNDLHMRVEHEEQKPSGPFWMGCSNNLEGNDVGQKLPYRHESSSSSTISPLFNVVTLISSLCLIKVLSIS